MLLKNNSKQEEHALVIQALNQQQHAVVMQTLFMSAANPYQAWRPHEVLLPWVLLLVSGLPCFGDGPLRL